jgi:hypothetical protein
MGQTRWIKQDKFRNMRSGRIEAWAATTADGRFIAQRLEMPGTPWDVYPADSRESLGWFPSLKAAAQHLDAQDAERVS